MIGGRDIRWGIYATILCLLFSCSYAVGQPIIYFGDPPSRPSPQQNVSPSQMLQEFLMYVGVFWVNKNNPPTEPEQLKSFDVIAILPEYRAYQASGGNDYLARGLTLEESWFMVQLVMHDPFVALINSDQPKQPNRRITRKELVPADVMVRTLARLFETQPDAQRNTRQSLDISTMVYDGTQGHVVNLRDYDSRTRVFTYWDPWGTGSFLTKENNQAGVSAKAHPTQARLWLLNSDELQKVVHASLVPVSAWSELLRRK